MNKKSAFNIGITIFVLTVLFVLYGLSFYFNTVQYWESAVVSVLFCVLFSYAVLRFIPHFVSFLAGEKQPHLIQTGDRTFRRCGTRELSKLILVILIVRLLEILLTYAFHYIRFGYRETFFEVQRIWLDLYRVETVFPLYRYLSNIFWIFTFNFNHARFIGSYVFTALAGAALYSLVLFDYDRKTARRAVRYFYFLPVSCLLMGSVPDGLFLFVSVLSLLFMRKKLFALANLMGMFAAMTHAFGALLFLPILLEYIAFIIENVRSGREMGKGYLPRQIVHAVSFILIPLGIGLVMLYSYLTFGEPLSLYRASFGSLQATIGSVPGSMIHWLDGLLGASRILTNQTIPSLIASLLPQILYLAAACVLIIVGSGKIQQSYLLLLTFTIPAIFVMNQLQDAARLITITAPFSITLAVCVKKRSTDLALTITFIISWIVYLYAFVAGYTGGVI